MTKVLSAWWLMFAIAIPSQAVPPSASLGFSRRPYMASHTSIVSPAVLASFVKKVDGSREHLELLVLWRGAPGWFLPSRERSSSSAVRDGVYIEEVNFGDQRLSLKYDPRTRQVWADGSLIALQAADNVVLIDRIETGSGSPVRATSVSRDIPRLGNQLLSVLQNAPVLHPFLQCDTVLIDNDAHRQVQRMCAAILRR